MTLLERARTVGASRDVATAPRGATVEDLRRSVRRRLAMEKVAALMAEPPPL